jgi:hypothetical protein
MTRSSLEAAALSSGVNGEVTNGEAIKVTVTDTGSEMMRFADSACGVVHRATINVVDTQTSYNRKSSSSSSEPEVIDLISDNDSSVESVPMEEIKRSQVHGMACEDGSSEMKFHEFSTPRKAEISVSMGGEELTFKTNEEKNTGPLNNLKKRSASEVTNDAEARNCKNTKGRTPVKPGDLIEKVEPGLEIGSCIYAQWEEEGWHFATIYDVKRGSTPASTRYSVRAFRSRLRLPLFRLIPITKPQFLSFSFRFSSMTEISMTLCPEKRLKPCKTLNAYASRRGCPESIFLLNH